MNNQTYEITIDTKKSHCHTNIEFSQNNLNISELTFNITEDEKPFPLKDTDKIIVYFKKPDKTVVFQDKEVNFIDKEKGKIKVLLTSQTLAKSGDVNGEISIERVENGTKKRVSTYGFTFKVRSSIASNDSIESTNEFQVFDKIIKAGEKFEGVDIDGIIAAGELAKGAVKKTGDTMGGNLFIDKPGGVNGIFGFGTGVDGKRNYLYGGKDAIGLYSDEANQVVWKYTPSTKTFTLEANNSNLVKKTGDTMEGHITFPNNRNIIFTGGGGAKRAEIAVDGNDNFFAWNNVGNKYLWKVEPSGRFEVQADNLLSKSGGDVTGTIAFTDIFPQVFKKAGRKSWVVHRPDGNSLIFVPEVSPNSGTWDWNNQIEFKEDGSIKQAKDTFWTDIPLQPNVSNIDGMVTQARRLGGTVSINMTYRATSLVNNFVMKLPQVFRPDRTIDTHIIDGAGRAARAIIDPDGTVYCSTVNEDIRATITYNV